MKSCTSGRRNKFYLECFVAATTLNHDATLEYKVFNFSFFKKIKNKNLSTLIKSYLQKIINVKPLNLPFLRKGDYSILNISTFFNFETRMSPWY